MEDVTEKEVLEKIAGLGLPEGDERIKSIACALIGHSNIITNCFGYRYCARCEEQVGDSLGGYFDDTKKVIVGHNCDKCRENYANMDWKDKLFVVDPFA